MSKEQGESSSSLNALTIAALGVVFGDIGTSPLYSLKTAFEQGTKHSLAVNEANVLGILSLIVWALLIIVTLKYVVIVLRADNHGEGGVVALMARVIEGVKDRPRRRAFIIALGLFGASLFYGDGVITPAISVLSAVEGLGVAAPGMEHYVVPLTIGILIGLFAVQHNGTAAVGKYFGPIVCVWFVAIALIGLHNIVLYPQVLRALSPHYGVSFLVNNPGMGLFALGAVFLTMTGGEALYADMGHFGAAPIRRAWLGLVLPCLLCNYFGQGALLIAKPATAANPFFLSVPGWALYPMVGLATIATVIASQALITGAYSVTRELIQLGYSPRLTVRHTSGVQMGQIYLPFVNIVLLLLVIAVVLGFKSSDRLAAAYGIAVTLTMLVTSVLALSVAYRDWHWPKAAILCVFGPLFLIELSFLVANGLKILDGGWFPLAFGAIVFTVLTTWKRGRLLLAEAQKNDEVPLTPFVTLLADESIHRVPHTAIFLSPRADKVPTALLHNLKHNLVLHERTIFVSVVIRSVPRVPEEERMTIESLGGSFHRVYLYFGFMEEPNVPLALQGCSAHGLALQPDQASYFLSRETILPTKGTGMALWRERLFEILFRNASGAANFFNLPTSRVVELGSRVMI